MTKKIIITFICSSATGIGLVNAQDLAEWSGINGNQANNSHTPEQQLGASDFSGKLFVGTSQNNNTPSGTANDIFSVDTGMNTSEALLSGLGVWGATADPANERILFTQSSGEVNPGTGGDNLFEVSYSGGAPTLVGRIVDDNGDGVRIDGLAMRNGVLYGYNAGGGVLNGFYRIDLNTFLASQVSTTTDSISGIDADPDTCVIYGTNDSTAQVVTIDPNGVITDLIAYPAGFTDIDGIAVGGGFAYLVTDQAQDISVLNLSTLTYETALTSPFAAEDTFSAGALALAPPPADGIFKNGFEPNSCADIQ